MLLYLHGFASGPLSTKAQEFKRRFAALGIPLELPALDEGDFTHLTLTRQLAVVERCCRARKDGEPLVLIGSSMGGYLSTLYASAHPVTALVLMAPAVDLDRSWRSRLGPEALAKWEREGTTPIFHFGQKRELPLAFGLLEDAPRHAAFPRITAPTLVLHGTRDETVRQDRVEAFLSRTPSARLVLYDSGHELTDVVGPIFEEARTFLASLPEVRAAYPSLARTA